MSKKKPDAKGADDKFGQASSLKSQKSSDALSHSKAPRKSQMHRSSIDSHAQDVRHSVTCNILKGRASHLNNHSHDHSHEHENEAHSHSEIAHEIEIVHSHNLLQDDDSEAEHNKLYNFVHHSTMFEGICTVPILLNCAFIGFELDWCDKVEGCDDQKPASFGIVENALCGWFLLEWSIRVGTAFHEGKVPLVVKWFKCGSNQFDTFLVWVPGVILTWALATWRNPQVKGILQNLRVLRAFRLMRFVRAMRHNSKFRNMWILVKGLGDSMPTLISAASLIIANLYIFGVFATHLIGHNDVFKSGTDDDSEEARGAQQKFKDLGTSMVTLLRFQHSDDAQGIMDALLVKLPYIWVFLWAFIGTSSYVLMNLVTAVIVNQALENQQADDETLARLARLADEEEMAQLKEIFLNLDEDASGYLDSDEFKGAFRDPQMKSIMTSVNVQQEELLDLFVLLDTDEEGMLSLEEFQDGISHLRGDAKSKDMIAMIKNFERVKFCIEALQKGVEPKDNANIERNEDSGSDRDSEDERVRQTIPRVQEDVSRRMDKVEADMEKIAKLLHSLGEKDRKDGYSASASEFNQSFSEERSQRRDDGSNRKKSQGPSSGNRGKSIRQDRSPRPDGPPKRRTVTGSGGATKEDARPRKSQFGNHATSPNPRKSQFRKDE